MELNRIRQQLSQVDQIIASATQALREDKASQELKDYVYQLGAQSREAQQALKQAQDAESLIQCIDELAKASDRADRVCANARSMGALPRIAVHQAHLRISELKQQLH